MMSTHESHSSLCFPCCTPARVSAAVTLIDPLIFLLLDAISSNSLVTPTSIGHGDRIKGQVAASFPQQPLVLDAQDCASVVGEVSP